MRRKRGQFGNSYQTLAESVEETELKLWWLKFLRRHRGALNRIADIVQLGCCGDRPYSLFGERQLCLRLQYCGKERSHTAALLDLARIEKALQAELGECQIRGGFDRRPEGQYQGNGKLGDRDIKIELDVPWIPCGCEIRTEQVTTYSRAPGIRRYRVVCSA